MISLLLTLILLSILAVLVTIFWNVLKVWIIAAGIFGCLFAGIGFLVWGTEELHAIIGVILIALSLWIPSWIYNNYFKKD